MYSVSQLIAITAIFGSLALSLPLSPETDLRPSVINDNPSSYPPLITGEDLNEYVDPSEDSSLNTRAVIEENTDSMEKDSFPAVQDDFLDPEKKTLETREPHSPHPEFAPTDAQRKKMKANVDKGLDPLGRNGDQVAKAFGTTNTGHDNGATEYIEQGYKKLNGGKEMKGPCGKGCQNSMYHKFEEESQEIKYAKAHPGTSGHH